MRSLREALVHKHLDIWPKPYNISKRDCVGYIKDFPPEIVTLAIKCTSELRPKLSDPLGHLQDLELSSAFVWDKTPEGHDFWSTISREKDFSVFYKMYNPKALEERLSKK